MENGLKDSSIYDSPVSKVDNTDYEKLEVRNKLISSKRALITLFFILFPVSMISTFIAKSSPDTVPMIYFFKLLFSALLSFQMYAVAKYSFSKWVAFLWSLLVFVPIPMAQMVLIVVIWIKTNKTIKQFGQ
jgi:hypothetical protein